MRPRVSPGVHAAAPPLIERRRCVTALAAAWLIGTAAKGFRGPIGWFLTAPPVVYIGRISYGLYVLRLVR